MALTGEQADAEINVRALPVFHDFRYRDSDYTFYRQGLSNEFSEFTFNVHRYYNYLIGDPNWGNPYRKHDETRMPVTTYAAQMSGGRDTGLMSGQYAYCAPRRDLVEVVGPRHPFRVTYKPEGLNPAYRFARTCRQMLRLAETLAGVTDWSENIKNGTPTIRQHLDTKTLKYSTYDLFWVGHELTHHRNETSPWSIFDTSGRWYISADHLEQQIMGVCEEWAKFKMVHPANILLSRYGFDGIVWGEYTQEYGDCGDWGCLLFPPITDNGEVVGLNPTPSIYMLLP